jgi:hypothetical protein
MMVAPETVPIMKSCEKIYICTKELLNLGSLSECIIKFTGSLSECIIKFTARSYLCL